MERAVTYIPMSTQGWGTGAPGTLLGYHWTLEAVLAISLSAFLGFLISLSTFLVIGATGTVRVCKNQKYRVDYERHCFFYGIADPVEWLARSLNLEGY
eukprot:scaffold197279_cov22-Tisochrysis_lutea.AAC.1